MKEYNIYTIKRSGSHAVIFWLLSNFVQKTVTNITKDIVIDNNFDGVFFNTVKHPHKTVNTHYIKPNTHVVMYGHEDSYIPLPFDENNVIIIRDIINIICSYFKKNPNCSLVDINKIISLWKQHITFVETAPSNIIIYNHWLLNESYREQVCRNFGIKKVFDTCDIVPNFWQGSSFNQLKIENDKLRYIQRYKQTTLPIHFVRVLLNDPYIEKYCKNIFDIDVTKIF